MPLRTCKLADGQEAQLESPLKLAARNAAVLSVEQNSAPTCIQNDRQNPQTKTFNKCCIMKQPHPRHAVQTHDLQVEGGLRERLKALAAQPEGARAPQRIRRQGGQPRGQVLHLRLAGTEEN